MARPGWSVVLRVAIFREGAVKALVLLGAVAALAGCQTPEERFAPQAADACAGYGFTPGTVEFAQCQMQIVENKKAMLFQFATRPQPRPMTCRTLAGITTCQ